MEFSYTDRMTELAGRTRAFIAEHVIPRERDPRRGAHGPDESLREELVELTRAIGLLSPHASPSMGGMGLSHVEKAVVFAEAGYSALGPIALNIQAPDEGNVHLLELIATPEQRERWLRPIAAGYARSCFAMTEPPPGAGSDPSMLQTTWIPDGDSYVLNGAKWFVTGALGASFAIVMAKGPDDAATMFLVGMDRAGMKVDRLMESMDSCFAGGHGVLTLHNVRVPAQDVLGEVGKGFQYAQHRLAPARLTHCMRWIGQARRTHDIAVQYALSRRAFGKLLRDHEGVGFMLADNQMDLQSAWLTTLHTAWTLDQGSQGLAESSACKVQVSEAVWRVIDRCVQILGGQGVTEESAVMQIFKDIRSFRIYDGPNEVHRWAIARRIAPFATPD